MTAWRRPLRALGLAGLVGLAAGTVSAHEVSSELVQREATVVTLRYADGEPFAGEAYEVRADGAERPLLSGRTDAQGRAVFLLDGPGPWRFRAFSDDGHGVERVFSVAGASSAAVVGADGGAGAGDRTARLLFGAAVLLAVFAALQRWLRRRPPR